MLTKASSELTLFDRLSRLTFYSAAKLLGAEGSHLITAGGKYDIDIFTQVQFDRDRFRLTLGSPQSLAIGCRGRLSRPARRQAMFRPADVRSHSA